MKLKNKCLISMFSVLIISISVPILANTEIQLTTSKIEQVNLPETSTSIENFTYTENDSGITITGYIGNDKNIIIPSQINEKSVKSIGPKAFWTNRFLINVSIPNTVTSIGERAFCGCNNLENVNIPNTVTSIGERAFSECFSLKNISIPDSVLAIGSYAFQSCASLEDIKLSKKLKILEKELFSWCGSLQHIELPEGITSIEERVFQNCYSLTQVNIPSSVTSIGNYAFFGCQSLIQIDLPEGVKSIGDNVFFATQIKNLILPSTLVNIGWEGCWNLESVEIPSNILDVSKVLSKERNYKLQLIIGESNSSAESFAKENNILFIDKKEMAQLETDVQYKKDIEDESIYTIKAIIKNVSNTTVKNAEVEFFPKVYDFNDQTSFISVSPSQSVVILEGAAQQQLGDINPGKTYEIIWKVKITPSQDIRAKYSSILEDLNACNVITSGDNVITDVTNINKQDRYSLARIIGTIYEQIVDTDETTLIPQINSVKVELVDSATNTYVLSIDNFKCDDTGKPFFYWKADEAMFTNADEDFTTVECVIDKEISGRSIPVKAFIGDGLGHAVEYTVWLKAN